MSDRLVDVGAPIPTELPRANTSAANAPIELLNIPVASIEFGDRARQSYKDLGKLVEDFRQKGIITPITVKRQDNLERPFLLLAGGRRYSAAVLGGFETIPARVYPATLDYLDMREIELMENVSREGLDWKEEVWLTEEIHRLKVLQHGEAHGSSLSGHSGSDTAKILNVSPMSVSRDRKLAQALESNPLLLSGASTKSEALRIVKKLERENENEVASKKFQAQLRADNSENVKRTLVNGYIVGDFFEGVENVPDRAVGLIELDPPYGIELHENTNNNETAMRNYNEIAKDAYPEFLARVLKESYRVMFPDSWIIVWYGFQWYQHVMEALLTAGLNPCPIPAAWIKTGAPGQTRAPEHRLGSAYEQFIYAKKGSAIIRNPGRNNLFHFRTLFPDHKVHPTERPIELVQEILATFATPGAHIMVPFLGSGNSLLAGANLGMSGFGWDLGQEFKNAYVSRVASGAPTEYRSYRDV